MPRGQPQIEAMTLLRAFDLAATSTDYFTDDEGNIHENSINALARSGITGGCDTNRYCPNSPVTRALPAWRALEATLLRGEDPAHGCRRPRR